MQAPQQFCESITLKSKSSFLFSFHFLKKEQRRALMALYAFCRVMDDCADEEKNKEKAEEKLNAMRKHIQNFPCADENQPLFYELSWAKERFQLKKDYFFALLDGMEHDVRGGFFQDFKELEKYCFNVASAVGLLIIPVLGYTHPQTEAYAYDLGIALQLTNILRDIKEDRLRGRIYIPLDLLKEAPISPEDFLKNTSPEVLNFVGNPLIFKTKHFYESAENIFQSLPQKDQKNQRIGLMMGAIYYQIFQKIEKNFPLTVENRVKLTKTEKIRAAWKAYFLRKIQ